MTDSILWWLRLGAKLILVAPGATITLVFLGFFSQVAMLASFLVPLKVIMILGSGSEISLPLGLFPNVSHDVMVLSLSALAVAFYVGYLVSGRLIERIADAGSARLLEQTSKVVLFENQEQVAANAYKRYTGTLSRFLFALFAGSVIGYLYPEVILLVLGSGGFIVVASVLGARISKGFARYLRKDFPKFVSGASGVVFLGIFGLVVADFLWFTAPGFLVAIIGLIFGRQLLTQLTDGILGIRQLVQQKKRISVLFFSGEVLPQPGQGLIEGPWGLLRNQTRSSWIDRLMSTVLGHPTSVESVHWRQTGIQGVIFVEVGIKERAGRFLVKIFDQNRTAQALHEASLLFGEVNGLPAPRLVDASVISGFHVHTMDVSEYTDLGDSRAGGENLALEFRRSLLAFSPPPVLVERYGRSKPMLWDRLDTEMFDVLSIVASRNELPTLENLRAHIPEVKKRLRALPLCLHNPVATPRVFVHKQPSQVASLHWGQWSVEPAGAAWPHDPVKLNQGASQLVALSNERPVLADIPAADFELAALMFEFERQFRRENLQNCLEIAERASPLLDA